MKSQLFIPDKIKVGYQHRSDTYTKKLAYVIYYDKKGVLRKEKSWRGWIQDQPQTYHVGYEKNDNGTYNYQKPIREEIPAQPIHDFDNVPMEGFVLNKGAGGAAGSSSSWNTRRETIRVYDPRDFEFEISIANLLFILENSNSYKGKGLEGKFIYSWEGSDLVLLPEECQEYKESMIFTGLKTKKISIKELVPGGIYLTKSQKNWIYLGKFDYFTYEHPSLGNRKHDYDSSAYEVVVEKLHIFQDEQGNYVTKTGGSDLAEIVNDIPVSNYAELVDNYYKSQWGSKPVNLEFLPAKVEFIKDSIPNHYENQYIIKINDENVDNRYYHYGTGLWSYNPKTDSYKRHQLQVDEKWNQCPHEWEYPEGSGNIHHGVQNDVSKDKVLLGYKLGKDWSESIKSGVLKGAQITGQTLYDLYSDRRTNSWLDKTVFKLPYKTEQDLLDLNLGQLYIVLESGVKILYNEYKKAN